jgi:integrase
MAEPKKWTDRAFKALAPGKHPIERNLYMDVSPTRVRTWFYRYWRGADHWMSLGDYSVVSFDEARDKVIDARRLRKDGIDPLEDRRNAKAAKAAATAIPRFGQMADTVAADLAKGFRNQKHAKQWIMTLTVYAAPLRDMRVDQIETTHVLSVLRPLWLTRQATAQRLRGRIEKVLDAAKALGHRSGENPSRWKGCLDHLLPKREKIERDHHAAMPYPDIPSFIAELRERAGVVARALEFAILTATRAGEATGARWEEIDLDAKVWTVPAARMKAGRAHSIPLSQRALEIIETMGEARASPFIFSANGGSAVDADSMLDLMRRMGVEDATAHGFRSSFRDWCGNETHVPREIAEAALAHSVGNAVEVAYRRSSALEKRRVLMQDWANYIEPRDPAANVVQLRERS